MARENNEGGVVWLSFPFAVCKWRLCLKMSDPSVMGEKTPQRANETVKITVKTLK